MAEPFGEQNGFLAHTLAHAEARVEPRAHRLPDGTLLRRLDLGILHLRPAEPGKEQLLLSAGIHGNETAPIEMLDRLVDGLLEGRLTPATDTLFILGNPIAIKAQQRFMDANMNRLFAGAHDGPQVRGTREAARARRLEERVSAWVRPDARLHHYDLHTAIRPSLRERFALLPWLDGKGPDNNQRAFLQACGIGTLVLQHRAGTTFASWTRSRWQADSMTLELGPVRPFGQNDPEHLRALEQTLDAMIQGQWPAGAKTEKQEGTTEPGGLECLEVAHEIINTGDSFRLHIPEDAPNFTEYAPGTLIWEDGQEAYRVGDRPEAIIFPNPDVPRGHRAGLMVRSVE